MLSVSENKIDFIVSCLDKGFTESQIAQAIGVTPSSVQQLIEAKNLRAQLQQHETFDTIDKNLNAIELNISDKLNKMLSSPAAVLNPMQAVQILRIVNNAKRRSTGEGRQMPGAAKLVTLKMPEHIKNRLVVSAENHLLEVNGQSLATMPSNQLKSLLPNAANAANSANSPDSTNLPKGF